jgi:hypothetical protein
MDNITDRLPGSAPISYPGSVHLAGSLRVLVPVARSEAEV